MIGGEVEDDGSAATRRVVVSHEELCLLVVSPPVGVTAPTGGAELSGHDLFYQLRRENPTISATPREVVHLRASNAGRPPWRFPEGRARSPARA